jgi:excisionase family DNA binding protein
VSSSRTTPVVMSPTAEDAAFITHALRDLARTYRRNGAVVPAGVTQLASHLISGVNGGQAGSSNDTTPQTEERVSNGPSLLVRYETAAELLEISVRTVKRLIAAGELQPVRLGGTSRLRRVDLETYIDQLANNVRN